MPACPPSPPAVVHRMDAEIPDAARNAHIEGTAVIKIDLDAAGKVVKSTVQKSSGNVMLDGAAMRAANGSAYRGATDGCKPVASVFLMVVDMQ